MCAIWDLVLNDGLCWRRKKNSNNHSSLYAIQASHKMCEITLSNGSLFSFKKRV